MILVQKERVPLILYWLDANLKTILLII